MNKECTVLRIKHVIKFAFIKPYVKSSQLK